MIKDSGHRKQYRSRQESLNWQAQISGELPNVRFCPMCGKRLEVEP